MDTSETVEVKGHEKCILETPYNEIKCVLSVKELKGWLAIAKLKPFSLFISLLSMLKKAFDNVKIEK